MKNRHVRHAYKTQLSTEMEDKTDINSVSKNELTQLRAQFWKTVLVEVALEEVEFQRLHGRRNEVEKACDCMGLLQR